MYKDLKRYKDVWRGAVGYEGMCTGMQSRDCIGAIKGRGGALRGRWRSMEGLHWFSLATTDLMDDYRDLKFWAYLEMLYQIWANSSLRPLKVHQFLSLVPRHRISASALMNKLKKGWHFVNMHCTEKCQSIDPTKVWISSFLSLNGNGISALAILKKSKNGHHFVNIYQSEIFN